MHTQSQRHLDIQLDIYIVLRYVTNTLLHHVHLWYTTNTLLNHVHLWYTTNTLLNHVHLWYTTNTLLNHVRLWYTAFNCVMISGCNQCLFSGNAVPTPFLPRLCLLVYFIPICNTNVITRSRTSYAFPNLFS